MNVDEPEPQRLFLLDLPYECLVEIFLLLDAAEICAAACCSKEARAVAAADVLWRELCVKGQHGASLQFKEMLGTFSHPDARRAEKKEAAAAAADGAAASSAPPPAVRRSSSTSSTGTPWREVYFRSLDTLKNTVCIDMGRGYAKYGLANGTPAMIQICQPNAEATADSLASLAFRRLNLRRSDLPNLAAIVAEPFRLASSRVDNERQSWRHDVERKYLQYFGLKKLCVVDSASLCLFANSLTSGVVVNIGFGVTFVVPVLGGHVKRDAVKVWPVGGMTLTQWYGELLDQAGVDAQWSPEMGAPQIPPVTVARNLKEASIEAAPTPLRETFGSSPYSLGRVLARDDAPRKEVMLGEASFSIGWERFVVLFTPRNSRRRRAIRIHTAQFLLFTGSSPPRFSSTRRR